MFAALTKTDDGAIDVARRIGGRALIANESESDPVYRALVIGEDRDALAAIADHGLYRVHVRRMRHQRRFWPEGEPTPGLTAAFAQWKPPELTHEEADAHWRDVHAGLALRHHPGVWQYHQVSIDEVLDGRAYDGIALLSFASAQEHAERFFGNDDDVAIIMADVPKFIDPSVPPDIALMTEWRFEAD
jgi:hypothetical protein